MKKCLYENTAHPSDLFDMLLGTEFLACFVNLDILELSHLQTHAFQ